MTEKKHSVDLTKKLLTSLVNTVKEVIEAKSNDGKISKFELIGLGDNVIGLGSNLLKISQIKDEVLDIDSDERKELIEHILSLGVLGDKAEVVLINAFELIEGEITLYKTNVVPIIEIFKE